MFANGLKASETDLKASETSSSIKLWHLQSRKSVEVQQKYSTDLDPVWWILLRSTTLSIVKVRKRRISTEMEMVQAERRFPQFEKAEKG